MRVTARSPRSRATSTDSAAGEFTSDPEGGSVTLRPINLSAGGARLPQRNTGTPSRRTRSLDNPPLSKAARSSLFQRANDALTGANKTGCNLSLTQQESVETRTRGGGRITPQLRYELLSRGHDVTTALGEENTPHKGRTNVSALP